MRPSTRPASASARRRQAPLKWQASAPTAASSSASSATCPGVGVGVGVRDAWYQHHVQGDCVETSNLFQERGAKHSAKEVPNTPTEGCRMLQTQQCAWRADREAELRGRGVPGEQQRGQPARARAEPRVRSRCRCRNSGTEYVREYGMKWMSGSTKQQCDRSLASPGEEQGAGQKADGVAE
jgi:hypothetical protein